MRARVCIWFPVFILPQLIFIVFRTGSLNSGVYLLQIPRAPGRRCFRHGVGDNDDRTHACCSLWRWRGSDGQRGRRGGTNIYLLNLSRHRDLVRR